MGAFENGRGCHGNRRIEERGGGGNGYGKWKEKRGDDEVYLLHGKNDHVPAELVSRGVVR